jgi:hypothetical protein
MPDESPTSAQQWYCRSTGGGGGGGVQCFSVALVCMDIAKHNQIDLIPFTIKTVYAGGGWEPSVGPPAETYSSVCVSVLYAHLVSDAMRRQLPLIPAVSIRDSASVIATVVIVHCAGTLCRPSERRRASRVGGAGRLGQKRPSRVRLSPRIGSRTPTSPSGSRLKAIRGRGRGEGSRPDWYEAVCIC